MPESGASSAPPGKVQPLLPGDQRHLRKIQRPGGGLQHRRELAGHHPHLAPVRGRPHRPGQSDSPRGAGRHRPDHQRGGQLQQGVCQAGQRLQKAQRHHRHPPRGRRAHRLAPAGDRPVVCGALGRPVPGPDGHPHHRPTGRRRPRLAHRGAGQAGGRAFPLRPRGGRRAGALCW